MGLVPFDEAIAVVVDANLYIGLTPFNLWTTTHLVQLLDASLISRSARLDLK